MILYMCKYLNEQCKCNVEGITCYFQDNHWDAAFAVCKHYESGKALKQVSHTRYELKLPDGVVMELFDTDWKYILDVLTSGNTGIDKIDKFYR